MVWNPESVGGGRPGAEARTEDLITYALDETNASLRNETPQGPQGGVNTASESGIEARENGFPLFHSARSQWFPGVDTSLRRTWPRL
jgi:hypothetical protein